MPNRYILYNNVIAASKTKQSTMEELKFHVFITKKTAVHLSFQTNGGCVF